MIGLIGWIQFEFRLHSMRQVFSFNVCATVLKSQPWHQTTLQAARKEPLVEELCLAKQCQVGVRSL